MRGPFQGVLNIIRFNWPMFLGAAMMTATAALGATAVSSAVWRASLWLVMLAVGGGAVVSLVVSHVIYDRSDLYRFAWLSRAFNTPTLRSATFCQTGFDESSPLLAARVPATAWTLLDHYDPARMHEPSIQRARHLCPPAEGTLPAPFDAWPTEEASADGVIAMLAIHELRSEAERTAWFAEARRALRVGGRVVVVEHVRDLANVLAFGPGAWHFHSVASWHRSWSRAHLRQREAFRITPWVRVFVLEPS
jgi:Methyltransferase domain